MKKRFVQDRALVSLIAAVFTLSHMAIPSVEAAPASAPVRAAVSSNISAINLDLGTSARSLSAAKGFAGSVITVGNSYRTIHQGDLLTPSELVAATQIASTGRQSLVLSTTGAAVGGSFKIGSGFASLASFNLPKDVTAIDQGRGQFGLSIGSTMIDAGKLIGIGSPGSVFSIHAGSLDIASTGSISTLGSHAVNVSIEALGDINNAGTIASSGRLNLTAGGSIVNAAGATISGASGIVAASGSGQIVNAGTIAALDGDVVLRTLHSSDLVVTNTGGMLQSLSGRTILDAPGTATTGVTRLTGGQVLANELDIHGGTGNVIVDAENITAVLNIDAGQAHVVSGGPLLKLGTLMLSGDPTIINPTGSVQLSSNVIVPGQALTIIAFNDITATSGVTRLDTSSKTGSGGDITLLAGVDATHNAGTTDTINGTDSNGGLNPQGGKIVLPGVTIASGATKAGSNGGAILMLAHRGTGPQTGDVSTSLIDTSSTGGAGGNILIRAERWSTIGALGIPGRHLAVKTTGKTSGGAFDIETGQISVNGTPTYNDTTGAFQPLSGSFTSGATPVSATAITIYGNTDTSASAGSAGAVTLRASNSVQVEGGITGTGLANLPGAALSKGANVTLFSQNGQAFTHGTINTAAQDNAGQAILVGGLRFNNFVDGDIIANGTKGAGASVAVMGNKSTSVRGSINNSGLTSGGDVLLTSTTANVNVDGSINSSGKDNDVSGTINTITILSPQSNITVGGSINGSGKGGAGSDVTLTAHTGVRVGGDIISTGSQDVTVVPGKQHTGGNISIASAIADITILGGIDNSGAHDQSQNINLQANGTVEVGKSITAVGTAHGGNVSVSSSATSGDVRIGITPVDSTVTKGTPLLRGFNGGINVSSPQGASGNVNINATAANVYVGKDINASGAAGVNGALSINAKQHVFVGGMLNSSSTDGGGGAISVTASGAGLASLLSGFDTGAINASGKQSGGTITLDSENGSMLVRGGINAASVVGNAGSIRAYSLHDMTVQGAVNTSSVGGAPNQVLLSSGLNQALQVGGGVLSVIGDINTSAKATAQTAGAVAISGQTGASLTGSIIATGSTGGAVAASSGDGILRVSGNVNVSSNNAVGPAGNAGSVSLNASSTGAATIIQGNIIARGGTSSGAGAANGGKGGDVTISTALSTSTSANIGAVQVGSIDTRGGNTTAANGGGGGGNVSVKGETVQITNSTAGGASINASAGSDASKAIGTGGTINVFTNGSQPIPANFNLVSTKKTEVALPGALFEIGKSTINGSAGRLVTTVGQGISALSSQPIIGVAQSTGNAVTVTTTVLSASFDESSVSHTVTPAVVNGKAVRQLVTPAEALALYQTSRNITQTIGLTPQGAADDSADKSASPNNFAIEVPADFSKSYTAFNVSTFTNTPSRLTIAVPLSNTNPSVFIGLSKAASPTIAQSLLFTDSSGNSPAAYTAIELGSAPLTVTAAGRLSALDAGQALAFFGKGAISLANHGVISSDVIALRSTVGTTITGDINSSLTANADLQVSGSQGAIAPTGNFTFVALDPTATLSSTVSTEIFAKNISIGPLKAAMANPNVNLDLQSVDAFGTISIRTAGALFGLDNGHLYNVGNATVNSTSAAGWLFGGGFRIAGLSSLAVNTSGPISSSGTLDVSESANISLIGSGLVSDGGNAWNITTAKGNVVIGSGGTPASAVDLSSSSTSVTSGADTTIYGQGATNITVNGNVQANGNLRIGSVPSLHIVNMGTNLLGGALIANKTAIVEMGSQSSTTLTGTLAGETVQAIFHDNAAFTATAPSQISANSGLSLLSDGLLNVGSGYVATATGTLSIKASQVQFGAQAQLLAGTLGVASITTPTVTKSQILLAGKIDVEGSQGVTFAPAGSVLSPQVNSIGGDILIRSAQGAVNLGSQVSYEADGGNVIVLGATGVTGGTTTSGSLVPGNTVVARSFQNGAAFTGGGVEIKGGTTTSTIAKVLANRPHPFSNQIDPSQTGITLNINPSTKGEVLVGPSSSVILSNNANGTQTMNLLGQNSVVLITGTPAAKVTLDSVSITSATPVSASDVTDRDEFVVETDSDESP